MLVTNTEREKKKNNGRGEQQVGKNKNLEVFGFDRFEYSLFFNKRRAMKRLSDGYIRMIFLLLFVCFFFFFLIFRGIITIFTGFQHCQLHGEGKRKKNTIFPRASEHIYYFICRLI